MSRKHGNDSYHCTVGQLNQHCLSQNFVLFCFANLPRHTSLCLGHTKTGAMMNSDFEFPYTFEKIFFLTNQNEHDDVNSSKVQDYSPGKVPWGPDRELPGCSWDPKRMLALLDLEEDEVLLGGDQLHHVVYGGGGEAPPLRLLISRTTRLPN